MQQFFNLTEHVETLIPMYGTIHMITLLAMIAFVPFMIWKKQTIKKWVANRQLMVWMLSIYLFIDLLYWILIWAYRVEPSFERFPLHLCASLSLLVPILLLTEKYKLFRFFSYWSVCAGFISFVNPSFVHDAPWSFAFIHYLIRHYFLFFIPIFMFIGRGFEVNYREFLKSMATLAGYAFFIFVLNWITGANYMHLGQHNPLEIAFLPRSFTTWPWNYPSFVGVGIVLMHLVYVGFLLAYNKGNLTETEKA